MASAQVEQQTAQGQAGPEQEENRHSQLRHDEEELCEPALQIQATSTSLVNEAEASCLTSESGVLEQLADENQEQSTGRKEQEGASAESAQLRARQLAVEAAEAQEAAQQAAKLAAEKQAQAYEAAKEARDAINAEHEAAKAAALHEVEVMAERACKQQKLCAESSHETLRQLVQTTAEESLRQAIVEKAQGPNQSSQSSTGAEAARDDAFRSIPPQLAAGATETVHHMIENTINKAAADLLPEEGSQNIEQGKNPARDGELPTGPETPTRPGPQMGAQALEGVPIQPPASVNGVQVHPLDPSNITQNPFVNTSVLPSNIGPEPVGNSATEFLCKAPEAETYRTVPENQPTEQGPSPMQVG